MEAPDVVFLVVGLPIRSESASVVIWSPNIENFVFFIPSSDDGIFTMIIVDNELVPNWILAI